MQKIVPNLWYDTQASEAVELYVSLFEDGKILSETLLKDTPGGDSTIITFELAGQKFSAMSAGPFFSLNPSFSLMVSCVTIDEVNAKWNALAEGGTALMPLAEYPFSPWYGWIQDRFGLSWQLGLADGDPITQKITTSMLFSNDMCGKAEEALRFYVDVFKDGSVNFLSPYPDGSAPSDTALVQYANFTLAGIEFAAMDNAYHEGAPFNEAFSLMIECADQAEIDYFWDKLSAVPEAEQCGWVKDKFGVSWQIVSEEMDEAMANGTPEEIARMVAALLPMKKLDIAALDRARRGE